MGWCPELGLLDDANLAFSKSIVGEGLCNEQWEISRVDRFGLKVAHYLDWALLFHFSSKFCISFFSPLWRQY